MEQSIMIIERILTFVCIYYIFTCI